jgi:competence protein ComEC
MTAGDRCAPSIADLPQPRPVWARLEGLSAALDRLSEREREQLPLWLPVGLGIGIAAWFWLPDPDAWIAFLLAAASLLCGSVALGWGARWGRALAIFAAAAMIGCGLVWWKAERVAAPRLAHARMASFTGTVESVQRLPAREAVRVVVATDEAELPPRLRINVAAAKAPAGLDPGAQVAVRAWLMPPAPMAVPGAYDFARVAWFQGIGGTGRALDLRLVRPASTDSWRSRTASARQRLADHVRASLAGGEGGIAAALATGDQGGISEADAEAMRASGLAHLLSISGLHVTAVVGAVMLLVLKILALSPTLALRVRLVLVAAGAGALAGLAYTLLTGAEVPTVRACVAALLVLLGIALGREAITLRLVAVGALFVLLFWPDSLAGPSFQLSFAAITAIVALHEHPRVKALLSRREEGFAQRLGRFLLGLILTGIAVEFALTPIALYHFHKAGLYGALANVIAIPLTTFIVMPLEALALLLDLAGLGAPFWWLTGKALALLLALAHGVAAMPGAVASIPAMPAGAFALMVAGGLWFCLWRTGWRRWGLVPFAAGAVWAFATPPPDLLVTGDGRHLALRTSSGELVILRERAGDYVRDLLAESSGSEAEALPLAGHPAAACSRDLCAATIARRGRVWHILATRTRDLVDIEALKAACAAADIVVSDRTLPRTCVPRWLKADRAFLVRTGGLAIRLGERPDVLTVASLNGRHPWASSPAAKR